MKKAFTLIELIFVIVIIGVLASVAIPKFLNLTTHAKSAGVKSVVTSVQSSIDNIHGKWIINDSFSWQPLNGGSCGLNSEGYPDSLDDNTTTEKDLFKCVLKIPVPACADGKYNGCWKESPQGGEYRYYFDTDSYIQLEYNTSNGALECQDGSSDYSADKCKQIIY